MTKNNPFYSPCFTRKPLPRALATLMLPAALGGLLTPAALAQTALPEITVTAPAGGEFLSRKSIQQLRAARQDTVQLLTEVPGVAALAGGPISRLPTIRGLADERLRVTIDGADLYATCPNHMNDPLSYVSPDSIESVQVYKSVLPVSEGGDAIGGAVIVERAKAPFAPPGQTVQGAEVGASFASNGDERSADWAAHYGTAQFAAQYRGSFASADDYKAGGTFKHYTFTGRAERQIGTDVVGSTAYLVRNHALDLGWKLGPHELRAELGYQKQPYQLYPNQRMDLLDNEQKRANVSFLGRFDWGELRARVDHEEVDHFMDFGKDKRYWYGAASGGPNPPGGNATPCSPLGPNCAAGMPMYAASQTDGVKLAATLPRGQDAKLKLGAEWNRYQLDDWWPPSGGGMWPGTFYNLRDGERTRYAAFAEWDQAISAAWTTTLGVRYERVKASAGPVQGYADTNGMAPMMNFQKRDSEAFNATVAGRTRKDDNWNLVWSNTYRVSSEVALRLDLARQVRSPGLYELYPWSTWQMAALMNNFTGDGNGYLGNPDLKPEKAHTIAPSLTYTPAGSDWTVHWTPFYTYVQDYIDAVQWDAATNAPRAVPVRNQFTVLRYVNHDAYLYGHELEVKGPFVRNRFGDWDVAAALACTHGKNDTTGDNLYGIMPRHVKLSVSQRLGAWSQRLVVEAVQRKDRVSQVRNEIPTPGYALVHWQGVYQLSTQAKLEFGVRNLFDRKYYDPLAGAYVGQGTTMSNPPLPNYPQWGTPVPGPGRSLWAGVRMAF